MKIAFLGTPTFAVPSLEMLFEAGHELMVFTQPDRPQGRHAALTPPPVKVFAEAHRIPVFQFEKIKMPDGVAQLRAFGPDLMVTAAFGQILSEENLSIPKHGCINVHASLLPKYRGAAPIQWAIIEGEKVTGVTTMLTDIGLDTGDILLKYETPIGENETAGELYDRLSVLGAQTLSDTIARLEAGTLSRQKQDETQATKCAMLKKEHGKLDFSWPVQKIHDRVRGVNPWPGAFALLSGQPLKIWRTRIVSEKSELPVGTCFGDDRQGLFAAAKDGVLEILELQAPGGKRMEAKTYLRGKKLAGAQLI